MSKGTAVAEDDRLRTLTESLDLVAAKLGDPTPLIYARVFAEHPEMEALFWRDSGGLIRGQMLTVVFESLLDLASGKTYAPSLLQSERINHENLGVPPEVFDTFVATIAKTLKEQLGADWTAEMGQVWQGLVAEATAR